MTGSPAPRPRAGRVTARREVAHAAALREAALVLISPEGHADDARLQAACRLLRDEAPVYWLDECAIRPCWLVTRYADVLAVEQRPASFSSAPRTLLTAAAAEAALSQMAGRPQIIRGLIQMDRPDHTIYRAVAQPRFTPNGLAPLAASVAELAARAVDAIAARGGACEFAEEIAAPFTRDVMIRLLGVPREDGPRLEAFARAVIAANDAERCGSELPTEAMRSGMLGLRDYFMALAAERRATPRDDLATAIAAAEIDGAPLPFYELISYFVLLTTAGFDSSAYALAGGLHALVESGAFARLRAEPSHLDTAVEEMLRWTSPARSIFRTALEEVEVGPATVRPGEAVALFFNSANRDERAFAAADRFVVDRAPNPHLAFGWGMHHCLGHWLVRMELRAFFTALLRRVERVELAGTPRRTRSPVISGIAALPLRFAFA